MFMRDEWVFRRIDGRCDCDKVCLDVMLMSNLLSNDKTQSSLVDETPGRGFITIGCLQEFLSLGW